MRTRWHSSFFYFFFSLAGGPLPALLIGLYLSHQYGLLTRFKWFFVKSAVLLIGLQGFYIYRIASTLPAPFPLRELLNNSSAAALSSTLGLAFATLHLLVVRRREKKDFFVLIQNEKPIIPFLLCCAIGATVGIMLTAALRWYLLNY